MPLLSYKLLSVNGHGRNLGVANFICHGRSDREIAPVLKKLPLYLCNTKQSAPVGKREDCFKWIYY